MPEQQCISWVSTLFSTGSQNQNSTSVLLHHLSRSNQSICWEDEQAVFTYNVFLSYSSFYTCNYFYIALLEVSDSIQTPEMLFCLQRMLWEVYCTSQDPVSLVTFSKFACQHGAIHHQRHRRPVHGERVLEVNNLCILSFCFEYMDEEKIVVNICVAGDRQAEKPSPGSLWEWNWVLYKIGQSICGCRSSSCVWLWCF